MFKSFERVAKYPIPVCQRPTSNAMKQSVARHWDDQSLYTSPRPLPRPQHDLAIAKTRNTVAPLHAPLLLSSLFLSTPTHSTKPNLAPSPLSQTRSSHKTWFSSHFTRAECFSLFDQMLCAVAAGTCCRPPSPSIRTVAPRHFRFSLIKSH